MPFRWARWHSSNCEGLQEMGHGFTAQQSNFEKGGSVRENRAIADRQIAFKPHSPDIGAMESNWNNDPNRRQAPEENGRY